MSEPLDRDDEQPALAEMLRELVQCEGWQWLIREADKEFGPAGYGRRVNAAIAQIPPGPDRAFEVAQAVEKIHESCDAVNRLLKRPSETLASLTKKPTPRRFEHLRRTLETHR